MYGRRSHDPRKVRRKTVHVVYLRNFTIARISYMYDRASPSYSICTPCAKHVQIYPYISILFLAWNCAGIHKRKVHVQYCTKTIIANNDRQRNTESHTMLGRISSAVISEALVQSASRCTSGPCAIGVWSRSSGCLDDPSIVWPSHSILRAVPSSSNHGLTSGALTLVNLNGNHDHVTQIFCL